MFFEKIEQAYKKAVYTRADDNGTVFYFSSDDFEGLKKEAYAFKSSKGHTLQGYFYYYDGYRPGRAVVFEHGMGSGHRGYMKEIELLASRGYLVFAYDHTGCMQSGGESTGGFVQSLIDLNDAINSLSVCERSKGLDISVVGHSWGGFSTLNIAALHPEVKHTVAIAGFISVREVLGSFFGGIMSGVGKKIYKKEKEANPDFIEYDAISCLEKTKAKVLVIHSTDDKTLSFKKHFAKMQKALDGKENINFVKVSGKGHNPNYTSEAVKYKDAFFKEYRNVMKKKLLKTDEDIKKFIDKYDWNKMTEQDMTVWKMIFETLEA